MDQVADRITDELDAARKFLALCIGWLPEGLLRDMIRQVALDGRDPVAAWENLENRLR
ncbi:MAG TPA: hypothetical protein VLG48_09425 [Candidatus Methylomirabilis sp.]|nr:hypothetical protein [Candidatus Methylomirabilis sp.]